MTSVKDAEKFAFRTLSVDGLMDFWVGVTILLIGIGWAFDQYLVASLSALFALPMWRLSRKYFSEPRLGSVNLNQTRKARGSRQLMFSLLLGTFVMGVVGYGLLNPDSIRESTLANFVPMLPALILAVMVGMGTLFFNTSRFLAYAAWMVASAYYGVTQYGNPAAPMLMGSILPMAGGIYHFIKFIRNNPKAEA